MVILSASLIPIFFKATRNHRLSELESTLEIPKLQQPNFLVFLNKEVEKLSDT